MLLILVKLILFNPTLLMFCMSDFIEGVRTENDDKSTAEVRFDRSFVIDPVY